MKTKLLIAAAVAATAIAATPAAAQYQYPSPYPYPNNGYPYPNTGYPYSNNPYSNNGTGVLGSIINSVLGYGQYPYGNYGYGNAAYQTAVSQCTSAVEARLNGYAMNNQYNQWNPYNNPYSGWARQGYGRVLGVENVELRKANRIRVKGVATSGNQYAQQYGYGSYRYNSQYGTPDLKFKCNADRSGRVYDVDIERQSFYGRWR